METMPTPKPVKTQSRICFSIEWYATEEDALEAHNIARGRGETYNGGFYHGRPCGRDETWDTTDEEGNRIFAVVRG